MKRQTKVSTPLLRKLRGLSNTEASKSNFKSFKNKRNYLQVMLESTHPDIILGTQSWLSDKINTSEIFPSELGYDVIRRRQDTELISGIIKPGKESHNNLPTYRPPNMLDQQITNNAIQDITDLHKIMQVVFSSQMEISNYQTSTGKVTQHRVLKHHKILTTQFSKWQSTLSNNRWQTNQPEGQHLICAVFISSRTTQQM